MKKSIVMKVLGAVMAMSLVFSAVVIADETEAGAEVSYEADVNGDGKANALDYMILKRVVMKLGEFPCRHVYDETVVGNLHVFTCKSCGHKYERFDGELIG